VEVRETQDTLTIYGETIDGMDLLTAYIYSAIADFPQFTDYHAPSLLHPAVFISRSLTTASNSLDSSASVVTSLPAG
jgi:hypothetical protein